jgi:hypothetical protein
MLYHLNASSMSTARGQVDVPAMLGLEYTEARVEGNASRLQSEDAYAIEVWRG